MKTKKNSNSQKKIQKRKDFDLRKKLGKQLIKEKFKDFIYDYIKRMQEKHEEFDWHTADLFLEALERNPTDLWKTMRPEIKNAS